MNAFLLRQSIRAASEIIFSRSGGPGGQNVNKLNTKVTLKLRFSNITGLSDMELERAAAVLANRITNDGEIVIAADEERSQRTNLERAYFRMEALISSAARLPKLRRPTRPNKAAKEQRLRVKKYHSLKKAERRKTEDGQ